MAEPASVSASLRPRRTMGFYADEAVKYGYKEAIVINRLWELARHGQTSFPLWGDPWWAFEFPFWTYSCIKTTLQSLIEQSLVFKVGGDLPLLVDESLEVQL